MTVNFQYLYASRNTVYNKRCVDNEATTRWTFISARTSLHNKEVLTYLEQA